MKILVVEDDRTVAHSLELLLSTSNYAVDLAVNGETGLQMADAFDYDLILLDAILPGLDGISLCQQLRSQGMQVPILLLTNQSDGHQTAIALNAGADDYIVKPFDSEELMARIQSLLCRGALISTPQPATTDPTFELNATKEALRVALAQLQSAQTELQQKNQELEVAYQTIAQQQQQLQATQNRQQTEIKLRQREEFLSSIYDRADQAIFVIDVTAAGDFHYADFNRKAEQFARINLQEVQGKTPESAFGSDIGSMFRQNYECCLQTGTSISYEEKIVFENHTLWTLTTLSPSCNEQGKIDRIIGTAIDISDRKQTEEALRASERQYRQILDSIADIVFVKQPDSRLVWGNMAFRDYYGMTESELQGIIDAPFNEPDHTRQYLHDDAVVFSTGETLTVPEESITRHDGVVRTFNTIKAPIYNEAGKVVLLVGVCRDITDRKQAELALQEQMLREQVITDISHEIRRSLDLNAVLSRTGERVRELLNTDRVIIFRFRPDGRGDIIMESVGAGWDPILSTTIHDPYSRDRAIAHYRQGRVVAIDNIDQGSLDPCYVELLKHFQVKACLVVPILQEEMLWGLLIAHHCSMPRQWRPSEIELLQQLATHVEIAIHQSELYQRTHLELLERKRMQTVLEESEERFRTLSAAAPIGICQTNADGICLYTNARWQEMSGLSFEESLGNGWLQGVHPEDRPALLLAWETYLQGGNEQLPEFRLLTPQGEVRWVSAKVATLKSAAGEVIGYVGIDEDITERKLAEQKIREQAALLDITSDAIFVRDFHHRILYWNQGAERLYGWKATEAIGQIAYELLQNDAAQVTEIMQLLLHQGEWRGELHKATKTNQAVIIEARWTLVRNDENQPKFILSVDTDVTEKKQLEAQFYRAQRLESLGTLASGIAHDLNNVLTPILAISQLLRLKRPNLEARSQELLQVLENSAKRGANMVKQILTFTRGTSGDRIPLKIAPLLQEVTNVAQQTFPKSITIHANIPEQSLWLISADPTYLHQVFMNLCVNARDAMPTGGVLSLTAENHEIDAAFTQMNLDAQVGTYVVVTIGDTGTGIAPDVRDRIFEPFFTTKPTGQGTGLGLSTVLGIVKTYGGFVQVHSEAGRGSQFKVYLPTTEGISTDLGDVEELPHGDGELILIVDDDTTVQHTNRSLLESYHYTTLVANDGIDAIALYTKHQSDIKVVLIDVMMPNMDGVSVVHTLHQINPQVNVIAMSGIHTNREAILEAGAKVFLAKPYTTADLLRNVALLLLNIKETQNG